MRWGEKEKSPKLIFETKNQARSFKPFWFFHKTVFWFLKWIRLKTWKKKKIILPKKIRKTPNTLLRSLIIQRQKRGKIQNIYIRGESRNFSQGADFQKKKISSGRSNWFSELSQSSKNTLFWTKFLRRRQKFEKTSQNLFLGTFWIIMTKKTQFFGARFPLKLVFIGAQGAWKNFRVRHQKWISQNSTRDGPFGSAGGRILEGVGVRLIPPPPTPPPPPNLPLNHIKRYLWDFRVGIAFQARINLSRYFLDQLFRFHRRQIEHELTDSFI